MSNQSPETLQRQANVPVELAGERVDKVAAQLFSEFSRAELTRWMTEGALTLDGAPVSPSTRYLVVRNWCCKASALFEKIGKVLKPYHLMCFSKTRKSLLLINQLAWWCIPAQAMPMAPW